MTIDGNKTSQFVRMKTAADDWASVVKSSFLRRNNLLPMISATIQKMMEYPMVVTTFSRRKWDEVMRPILRVALPKAGVCRSFPREAVYGPRRYNGLGVQHPFVLQVSHHINALLRHGLSDSLTGQFLLSNLECHQLEIGFPLGVFQNQFSDLEVLATNTWAKRLWSELSDLDLHVAYQGPDLQLSREDDQFLVQAFMDESFSDNKLMWLNWCRMYLHVTSLSDISTADRTMLSEAAWSGSRDMTRCSPHSWPPSREQFICPPPKFCAVVVQNSLPPNAILPFLAQKHASWHIIPMTRT
jgi:hypothetical protein